MRFWLMDLATPLLLQMLSRSWQPHLEAASAPMQFAPAEGTAFFSSLGWREAEFRSVWEESLRLGRSGAPGPSPELPEPVPLEGRPGVLPAHVGDRPARARVAALSG